MPEKKANKLIVITGPTGIGKSALSYQIQDNMKCHIISADSRQVYKEMSIGTAKPSKTEIKDHNIVCCDYVSVLDDYNAGIFASDALTYAHTDWEAFGHTIMCGGTGLYIKAFAEGLDSFPDVPVEVRHFWQSELDKKGLSHLKDELLKRDPEYYSKVDINNPHRLLRALSIIDFTGKRFSDFLGQKQENDIELITLVLDLPREELHERINNRVLKMIDRGLVKEVEGLLAFRDLKSLNTVGYSEIFDFLDGKTSLDEAVALIQTHTRQYAKRQMTWQRKYNPGLRIHPSDLNAALLYIQERL